MQGIPEPEIPLPPIPPGGLKRCSYCKEYKEVKKDNFSTMIHTLSTGEKKRYWRARCKDCERVTRKKYSPTWTQNEKDARDRAATRLIKIVPRLFLPLFIEELQKSYRKEGLTNEELEDRLEKRTRYVKLFIQKADK